ncbi:hypothetical protein niasHT_028715 [Heterodera trifolii]|uniref:Uncharacterized protein n=1 Tax=Heterodera trifolii TaxID=157864 RepID=A0ABD2KTR7_9BILA
MFESKPIWDSIHQHSNHRDLIPAFQSLGLNSSAFQSLGLNSPTFQSLGLNPPTFQSPGLNPPTFQSLGLNSPTFQSLGNPPTFQSPGLNTSISITGTQFTNIPITGTQYQHFNHWDSILLHFNHWDSILLHSSHGLKSPAFQSPGLNPPTFQSLGLNSPTFQSLGNPPTFQSPGLNTSISITGTQPTNIPIAGTQPTSISITGTQFFCVTRSAASRPRTGGLRPTPPRILWPKVLARPLRGLASFWLFLQSPGLNPTSISITETQPTSISITGTQFFCVTRSAAFAASYWGLRPPPQEFCGQRYSLGRFAASYSLGRFAASYWGLRPPPPPPRIFWPKVLARPLRGLASFWLFLQSPGLNPTSISITETQPTSISITGTQFFCVTRSAAFAASYWGLRPPPPRIFWPKVLARPLRGLASFWLFLQSPGLNPTSISITETQPTSISITGTQFFCVTRSAASRPPGELRTTIIAQRLQPTHLPHTSTSTALVLQSTK